MSFTSWKDEFYPTPADKTSEAEAVSHSLRKWRGFLPKNLKKHDITLEHLRNRYAMHLDKACACCHHFYDSSALDESCAACPLFQVEGDVACDDENSVYRTAVTTDVASGMIDALKRARVHYNENMKKKKKAKPKAERSVSQF